MIQVTHIIKVLKNFINDGAQKCAQRTETCTCSLEAWKTVVHLTDEIIVKKALQWEKEEDEQDDWRES